MWPMPILAATYFCHEGKQIAAQYGIERMTIAHLGNGISDNSIGSIVIA